MNNVLLYWKSRVNQLEAYLQKLANETDQDVYKSGCVCLLKVHLHLLKCITAFSSNIALPESSGCSERPDMETYESCDSSDSESECYDSSGDDFDIDGHLLMCMPQLVSGLKHIVSMLLLS